MLFFTSRNPGESPIFFYSHGNSFLIKKESLTSYQLVRDTQEEQNGAIPIITYGFRLVNIWFIIFPCVTIHDNSAILHKQKPHKTDLIWFARLFLRWLRKKDSNPHKQSQSLSCYLYTIPHHKAHVLLYQYYNKCQVLLYVFPKYFMILMVSKHYSAFTPCPKKAKLHIL